MSAKARRNGFTLIEIAVVLILVGLLIGGVLKGSGMIKNSRIKNLAKQADEMRVAVLTFQERYGSFPGDEKISGIPNGDAQEGDGDMKIRSDKNEHKMAIADLRLADLIPAGSGDFPRHAFDGDVYPDWNANMNRHVVTFTAVPGDVARELDVRNDDGVYNTGNIRADADYTQQGVTLYFAL